MRRDIPIKKEAIEAMCKIAGRLVFSGFNVEFDFEREDDKYDYYSLIAGTRGIGTECITLGSDRFNDKVYSLGFGLPEAVSLSCVWMEIEAGIAKLVITFDFTDFVNANMENKRS